MPADWDHCRQSSVLETQNGGNGGVVQSFRPNTVCQRATSSPHVHGRMLLLICSAHVWGLLAGAGAGGLTGTTVGMGASATTTNDVFEAGHTGAGVTCRRARLSAPLVQGTERFRGMSKEVLYLYLLNHSSRYGHGILICTCSHNLSL